MRVRTRFFIGIPLLILALLFVPIMWNELPKEVITALDTAPSVTLYSIQPWGGPDLPEWDFHGHHVLGKIELEQEKARQAANEFKDAAARMESAFFGGGVGSNCVITPRHALRVVSEGHTYDLLLCYQCRQLEVFRDGKEIKFIDGVKGSPLTLNGLLTTANIPLADTPAAEKEGYAEEAKLALQKAEQGDVLAQKVIGMMYLKGSGVRKDEAAGVKWGSKAAEHGKAEDQFAMGELYKYGNGVKKDYAEALKWYRKAAEQGLLNAESMIGEIYDDGGYGLKRDSAEAIKWFRDAAERGDENAQTHMAVSYMGGGEGVEKDLAQAYMWDIIIDEAKGVKSTVAFQGTTPEQIAEGKRLAAEWKVSHAHPPAPATPAQRPAGIP